MTDSSNTTTDTTTTTTGTTGTGTGTGNGGRGNAASAFETARTKTSEAYAGLRERGSDLGQRTGESVSAYPMAAVAGGFAVGAVLAAVLPRTERETEMFGAVGTRITGAARDAARTAADAGREKVEEMAETAKAKVGEAVIDAVSATTGAALGSKS
jgi:ElaB/YqjD/DUF883 family membrane-anchored ribosome-binding protein